MYTKLIKFNLLALLVIASCFVNAQERILHGIVTTFDSIPLVGASVYVKSSDSVVKTDTLGQFAIVVQAKDKLKISAHGFTTVKVKTTAYTKIAAINMKLKSGEKAREYAIGYGYVQDAEKLNAVSQMNSRDLDFSQYSNVYDIIRGRFAGVQVQSNGDIIIRGVNSINLSSAALIVLDGVPVDQSILSSLAPANVKSINIMKDGSSAIYGSRGANGVVIIETKRGKDD